MFVPLLLITIVVLAITIIGIPILLLALPFVVLGLGVAWLIGFSGVANRLGVLVLQRLGRDETDPYTATIVGVLVIMAPGAMMLRALERCEKLATRSTAVVLSRAPEAQATAPKLPS